MRLLNVLLVTMLGLTSLSMTRAKPVSSERAQFRQWLVHYLSNDPEDEDLQNLVYGYALVDLNGDGRNEAIVWARDANLCGTSGCALQVFVHGNAGWRLFDDGPTTRPPIKILPTRTHGWRDLSSWQSGGGIKRPYEARSRFDGKDYDIVEPADWTGVKPRPPRLNGRVIIKAATVPLFPSRCQRIEEVPTVFGPMPITTGHPGSCTKQ